ncbi:MAG: LacI family transcriptional regulator, partial [Spirochaetales bacterium]|nr:LacI family transcriptional regulator [Spirochaetales bacterium]
MKRYATLKDVAKLAGTTAATVSYVLNEKEGRYISDETRRKVLEAAEQLEYVKSIGASSLKGKSRKLIAILIPQFENQFFTRIVVAS